MNQKVVASVDLEEVAWAYEGGHRAFLDQQRAFELAAGPQVRAVIDRHLAPTLRGIDPDGAPFARLGRLGLPSARRWWRPVEPPAADDPERGDVDPPAGLDVAEQALMFRLERLARRRCVEAGCAQGDAHRPLLAVVTQIDLALDRGGTVAETFAGQRLAGAALE